MSATSVQHFAESVAPRECGACGSRLIQNEDNRQHWYCSNPTCDWAQFDCAANPSTTPTGRADNG